MTEAFFARWPSSGAASWLGPDGVGWRLHSVEGMEEQAYFSILPAGATPPFTPADAAAYRLEQMSDTGSVLEAFGALMLVAFDVPTDRMTEVDRWYEQEHIAMLMRAPGWLRARRYRVLSFANGPRWTSMAFHELRDVSVMDSPERAAARSTPWRAELEKEEWFGRAGRGVFRPLS